MQTSHRSEGGSKSKRDVIPILMCIDSEPDEFDPKPNDPSAWRHVEECVTRFDGLRSGLKSATGRDVAFNWLVRADAQVGHIYGDAGWGLRHFRSTWIDLLSRGDEVGIHPHPQVWSDEHQFWIGGQSTPGWGASMLEIAFEAYARELARVPETMRYGNRFLNQEIADKALELGLKYDLTLEPGYRGRNGESSEHRIPGICGDYFDVPRTPYYARTSNYRAPEGQDRRALRMIPMSTADLTGEAPCAEPPFFRAIDPLNYKYDVLHLRIQPAEFRIAVDHILQEMTRPYVAMVIRCDMVQLKEVFDNMETLRTHPLAERFEFMTPQKAWHTLMQQP